ncbi:MAG: amino acid adenylation domain-containing protein [Muribaculaceae bacterium]|nr:amino acid adenylation domain-containing protein [Muribaculaceae bacterium]
MTNAYLQPYFENFEKLADKVAIVEGSGRRTTYGELGEMSRKIASALTKLGLPQGSFIPMLLNPSAEYIAAELGTWMAGHAIVPMGHSFPKERIEHIVRHSDAPLVIDENKVEELLKDSGDGYPEGNLPLESDALIIYTSGSTGEPKGILHTFESLNYGRAYCFGEPFTEDIKWGSGIPFYFIAAFPIHFNVLKGGGELHLFSDEVRFDVKKMGDYVASEGLTHMFISPSVLGNFHNTSKTLRVVYAGSERLSGECSRDGYKLYNIYGMSEMVGGITPFAVDRRYDSTPIGRPRDDVFQYMLVDDEDREVADGETGELVVKGKFTKGYYKDPEKTDRLYRNGWLHTGDLMRRLPDGNLLYVNRKDWMVKINGQRVEPGEVEASMKRLPGVKNAIVKGFTGKSGSQYLCGYFIPEEGSEITSSEIREKLSKKLPPYMVPLHLTKMESFPLLPNGKVNRKILLPPDSSELSSNYIAPETDVEKELCDAFAKVFKMDRVGAEDDFFMLGGDSIKVMALQQSASGLSLTAKIIYSGRTPRKIASMLESAAPEEAELDLSSGVPLSQTQLGIYAETMSRKGEAAYNNPLLLKLGKNVEAERLGKAVEAVIAAHPFVNLKIRQDEDGNPLMFPNDGGYEQSIEVISEKELLAKKDSLIEPFDLLEGPLFRIRIFKTDKGVYLFTDFHHIIYDGTSMTIFRDDLNKAYNGEIPEKETYTGFNVAHAESLQRRSKIYDEAKGWYLDTFGGIDLDSQPIADKSGNETEYSDLDYELDVEAETVERYSERLGVTPNILVLGAFSRLLGLFTGTNESLFATIYNGRSSGQLNRTIDMLVKTLPVYSRWDSDTVVSEWLKQLKEQLMNSMLHDIYSFAELAATTSVTSNVLFAYQSDLLEVGEYCGEPAEQVFLKRNATGSPLDFQVFVRNGKLVLHCEYMSNIYSAEFIGEMSSSYGAILRSMLTATLMNEVELLTESTLEKLESFNATESAYDKNETVVSLFEKAAEKYPDNVAVIYQDKKITYAETSRISSSIAGEILRRGNKRIETVGILIPRSEWMVLASLGVLKAGCCYQPLDSSYPSERLEFMLSDSGASLLITSKALRELVKSYDGEVLYIEDIPSLGESSEKPVVPSPSSLFTLLYTSGSTGLPKGVKLLHSNLVCFIDWYIRYYGITPDDRVGAYASYGFDANMMDMYPALSCGAAVCIIPEDIRLEMEKLNEYLCSNGVTCQFMTTQVGRQFAVDIEKTSLKSLTMGGEKLVPFKIPASYTTINAYGPTECTIFTNTYVLKEGETDIPIGKFLDNIKGYVVGTDGKRVPPGAPGELWIAGPHVADGYLNRPDKTAEVFIMNPFAGGDYSRVYRTGDIVRFKEDGNVDFIGRNDGQVKIRGFRVELTEVEGVIREYPGIKDATVAAFDHPSGGKYIAAYVVSDSQIDTGKLGEFILERKPPYMVPAVTMQIELIPLNQNQKVNRKALPLPEFTVDEVVGDLREPNRLENEIREIAGKILGSSEFGITTPFSSAGLTSILSIKLASQLYKRFGIEIPSKSLLNGGSVESVENILLDVWMNPVSKGEIVEAIASQENSEKIASKRGRSLLSFPQMGVYFECMKRPTDITYNIPAIISFDKKIDAMSLRDAVEKVLKAHKGVDSHFETTSDGVIQVLNEGNEVEVELLKLSMEELEGLKKEFVRPFRLSSGPLYRIVVAETPDGTYLLTDFHHLVFDGTSFDIFLNQLEESLNGRQPEEESYVYADYVASEKEFEGSGQFEENRVYFAEMLSNLETASEIPADLKGKEENGRMRSVSSPLDLKRIETFARERGITPAALMLAPVFYTVSRYINDNNVYLATISSGRNDVRTAETFGMFVNTLPLGITIGDGTVEDFIARTSEVFQGVLDHEKYPFAKISADHGFQPGIVYEYQLGVIDSRKSSVVKSVEALDLDIAKFKVSIHIENVDGSPSVAVFYNDALYSRKLMEGLARSIVIATENMLSEPGEKIRKVTLIDKEREKRLEGFRTEALADPQFKYYQAGLEYHAAKNPGAVALIACDAEYTYGEFDKAANRIANNLIKLGVKPRSRIALLLPRTSKVILSMFGVMKAGSAYIPCDPEYPVDRIQHILNDSEAPYVITTADRLGQFDNAIDVDTLLEGSDERPKLEITPRDLAYLIYTSGSTGRPKGVMLRHESIADYLLDHPANTHIHALAHRCKAFLSITTISFDMCLKEIGGALCNGLTLVFANEDQTTNPISLSEVFKRTGADAFNTTPSRMLQFMELPAFVEAIGQCHVIMCGGEKYADGLLDKLRLAAPEAEIFNTYGPTEITVSSNCKNLTHTDRVSVGRPLLNVTEFVVDKDGNELPEGIVGELYIGGLGVATGYNNLPEMTAERFIDYKGMRIYKSGDYARWTSEGDVEILGRTDNQIKLRGLRIELGEIEGAIAALEGIKNVVVKIVKIKGEEHLAAYFTADRQFNIPELKEELSRSLTKYMVPTAYLQMERMPITPNGKTDVKSLPEPELSLGGEYVEPANETEKAIADIFARILKLERVGANDSFYELGGTSLVTTRVIIETDKLGYNVAYGDVFAHPTPRKLANFILGIEEGENKGDEVSDYDYSAINNMLKRNTLEAFRSGEMLNLGDVMLTGATGYLGIHILRRLIDSDAGKIYCLVRGKDQKTAENRLKTLLFYYFEDTFDGLFGNRLQIIPGDVTDEIDSSIKVDTVINCAAIVKHFSEGTEIEDVNIDGARHCIDYCLSVGAKMIQISTASTRGLSVNGIPKSDSVFDEDTLYIGQYLGNKYIYSKFIAERLVLEAATKGLVAKIMRVGNLAPRSTDGEFQANFRTNSFMGRIKVYNMLGCCPYEARDSQVEFSPINEVSDAIVRLSCTPRECVVFHPYNNHFVLLGDVLSELGKIDRRVEFVEMDRFSQVLQEAKEDPIKAKQLSSMLAYQNMAKGQKSTDVKRSNEYTMQVLYRCGFSWTVTSWDYVDRFLEAIEGLGFFDDSL